MRLIVFIFFVLSLVGCERGYSLFYSSDGLIIRENDVVILYTVKKSGYQSTFLDLHGGGKSWVEWSKKIKVKYSYEIGSAIQNNMLMPKSVKIIEDIKDESITHLYPVSLDDFFDKSGVITKDKKFVLINSEDKIYNTITGQVHKDLGNDTEYQKFKKILKSKYEYKVKQKNRHGNLSTIYTLSDNAEYIVIYPEEVSRPDFIDFNI